MRHGFIKVAACTPKIRVADPVYNSERIIEALREAEAHKGPSVIIAYTPCSAHGIKAGMANVQSEMKRAVDAGYWLRYRYDPGKEDRKSVV